MAWELPETQDARKAKDFAGARAMREECAPRGANLSARTSSEGGKLRPGGRGTALRSVCRTGSLRTPPTPRGPAAPSRAPRARLLLTARTLRLPTAFPALADSAAADSRDLRRPPSGPTPYDSPLDSTTSLSQRIGFSTCPSFAFPGFRGDLSFLEKGTPWATPIGWSLCWSRGCCGQLTTEGRGLGHKWAECRQKTRRRCGPWAA